MKSSVGFHSPCTTLLAAAFIASAAAVGRAQQIDVTAGTATDQLGQRSSAVSVVPSVTLLPDANSSISLGASATRFATGVLSFGGGSALSTRANAGSHVAFTIDASANGARLQGDLPATFASAGLLPALELNASRLTLYGGGRAALGYSSLTTRTAVVGPTSNSSASRTGIGSVVGALLDLSQSPAAALRIGVRQERTVIASVPFTDQSASLHLGGALGAAMDATVGRRVATDEKLTFASGAVTLPMSNVVALQVGAGRYPSNRLMGTAAGNYLSAGLSIRFGAPHETSSQSAPQRIPGAPPVPAGYTRLSIDAPDATEVDVAGDFNEWRGVPAVKVGNTWYADLQIPPGQYRYAFRVDGREWRVPRGATAVKDGFGGESAWLTVREPGEQ